MEQVERILMIIKLFVQVAFVAFVVFRILRFLVEFFILVARYFRDVLGVFIDEIQLSCLDLLFLVDFVHELLIEQVLEFAIVIRAFAEKLIDVDFILGLRFLHHVVRAAQIDTHGLGLQRKLRVHVERLFDGSGCFIVARLVLQADIRNVVESGPGVLIERRRDGFCEVLKFIENIGPFVRITEVDVGRCRFIDIVAGDIGPGRFCRRAVRLIS